MCSVQNSHSLVIAHLNGTRSHQDLPLSGDAVLHVVLHEGSQRGKGPLSSVQCKTSGTEAVVDTKMLHAGLTMREMTPQVLNGMIHKAGSLHIGLHDI